MQATRKDILDLLRRRSQATVKEIGDELGLTSTGIRQHLTILERDGLVASHEERGHVGRPALVYRLSSNGDSLYPKKYDELANALIEEARTILGPPALAQLMKSVANRFATPHLARLAAMDADDRVEAVGTILESRGNIVSRTQGADGEHSVRKHTCEYWNVATKNSIVCALDVEFVRQLAGTDARLTTSLLRGDDCCTFHIKPNEPPAESTR